jgi:hypothetical protein
LSPEWLRDKVLCRINRGLIKAGENARTEGSA